MTSPGRIALVGGGEHRAGCEPIDRWLMERSGRGRVRVTVIPAASTAATLAPTAALARNYWSALGAQVSVVVPDAAGTALADPDVVVLTGGVLGRLVRALGASPLWARVLDLWRAGTALSGSSAGAMALGAWRLALRAPNPLRLVPGLVRCRITSACPTSTGSSARCPACIRGCAVSSGASTGSGSSASTRAPG